MEEGCPSTSNFELDEGVGSERSFHDEIKNKNGDENGRGKESIETGRGKEHVDGTEGRPSEDGEEAVG